MRTADRHATFRPSATTGIPDVPIEDIPIAVSGPSGVLKCRYGPDSDLGRVAGGGAYHSSLLLRSCRSCFTSSPAGATHQGHGPEKTRANRGSHSCAATGSDLDGPSHFLIRGIHGQPGEAINQTGRTNGPPQRRSQRHPRISRQAPRNPGTSAPWWISGNRRPLRETSGTGASGAAAGFAGTPIATGRLRSGGQISQTAIAGASRRAFSVAVARSESWV